jgi:hypothetical protein
MKAFIDRVDAALWLIVRRWMIRQLRKLVDVADDRLHAAEVTLREEISSKVQVLNEAAGLPREIRRVNRIEQSPVRGFDSSVASNDGCRVEHLKPREDFQQWEARRSGIAPITKKAARQRRAHMTSSAFDLKYAR